MYQILLDLADAWTRGEDCRFALYDALMEAGYPNLAQFHLGKGGCPSADACGLPGIIREGSLDLEEVQLKNHMRSRV